MSASFVKRKNILIVNVLNDDDDLIKNFLFIFVFQYSFRRIDVCYLNFEKFLL